MEPGVPGDNGEVLQVPGRGPALAVMPHLIRRGARTNMCTGQDGCKHNFNSARLCPSVFKVISSQPSINGWRCCKKHVRRRTQFQRALCSKCA